MLGRTEFAGEMQKKFKMCEEKSHIQQLDVEVGTH
jgi:hypothetical protein